MSHFLGHDAALPAPDRSLAALLSPALSAAFRRPASAAARWAHGPFLHWLVQGTRPRAVAGAPGHGEPGHGTAALREAAARLQPPAAWRTAPDAPADPLPIDLLLIEATEDAAAAAALDAWTPHLGARAVLLLHGAATADLYAALRGRYPHFRFPHGGGLGVVAVGTAVPGLAASLCRLRDPADIAVCRDRFALLGATWEAAGDAGEVALLRAELAALRASTSWRITAPLRVAVGRLRGPVAVPPVPPPSRDGLPRPARRVAPRVLFAAAEPDTPGALYRCARPSAAAAAAGWEAAWRPLDRVTPAQAARCDVLVLWRAPWTERVEALVAAARGAGARVVLDLDDMLCDPSLPRPDMAGDGAAAEAARLHARALRRTAQAAAALFASTAPLAAQLRAVAPGRPVFVLPNGFDAATHASARQALRARRAAPADGLLRLGYAAGTRTHQRDFAMAAPAVVALLRARPEARLVLFAATDGGRLLDPAAFPALADRAGQIEWRRSVALPDLPDELARFDINLAPLAAGDPFCEAKSELKYVEAALVEVPTVASPTTPFAAAIRDGETGCLARDEAGWRAALARLAGDPALRQRMAAAAYRDVLLRFGPELRLDTVAAALAAVRSAPA